MSCPSSGDSVASVAPDTDCVGHQQWRRDEATSEWVSQPQHIYPPLKKVIIQSWRLTGFRPILAKYPFFPSFSFACFIVTVHCNGKKWYLARLGLMLVGFCYKPERCLNVTFEKIPEIVE